MAETTTARRIPVTELERFMIAAFMKIGVPETDARICAEVLSESDRRGIDSHGIARFKGIYYDRIKQGTQLPVTKETIIKDGSTTAVIDAGNGMGQVASKHAMALTIKKAKAYGMGMVTVRGSNHYGIAGYYVTMATNEGMIGITGTNARPSVAPTFGVENMLGTNPLTIGIPTDEAFPFVLDCATSLSQRGKVEVYARAKKPLPAGWVIGSDGATQTDATAILDALTRGNAALAPLGGIGEETAGYKGYGYCTVVEILSAALAQGAFLKMLSGVSEGKKVPHRLGHFFMAVDVEAFTELPAFKKTAGDILRQLRASKKMPGHTRIYTAGEKEYDAWQERRTAGIPITDETWREITTVCTECGLIAPKPLR